MLSRLTGLGWVLVSVVVLTVIVAVVILSRPADPPAPRSTSPAQNATIDQPEDRPLANRVYDGYDAIDFVRLTYEQYMAAAATELAVTGRPPYQLDTLLRRLEVVRNRLDPNAYKDIVKRYTDAERRGGVQRDELLCGRPDISSVETALQLGGNENVVVRVTKQAGQAADGSMEVTVNLKSRKIVELTC